MPSPLEPTLEPYAATDAIRRRYLFKTLLGLFVPLMTGLLALAVYSGSAPDGNVLRYLGVSLAVAGASLCLGLLLGFLFGIPRSMQAGAMAPQGCPAASANDRGHLRVNTNLEQISDWLTKIMVGIGLTQIQFIPERLSVFSTFLAGGLGGQHSDQVFIIGVIFFYAVCGFICGYLLTRLFLAGAFHYADKVAEEVEELTRSVREAQEQAEQARDEARTAQARTAETQGAVQSLQMQVMASADSQPHADSGEAARPGGADTLEKLAGAYDLIRQQQPNASAARTSAMVSLFRRMREAARTLEGYDVRSGLAERDPGRRLFAYAYLSARPDPDFLMQLVDRVTQPDESSFAQFHGILAIRQVLARLGEGNVPTPVLEHLGRFHQSLRPGTGRHYELGRILHDYTPARPEAA